MNEIIAGIFTLFGVLIGGFLQYLFTKFLNKNDFKRKIEVDSYIEYFNAIAQIKTSLTNDTSDEYRLGIKKLIEAKSKIIIVGNYDTIKSLEAFEKHGAIINDHNSKKLIYDILISMRKSLDNRKRLDFECVKTILLG